MYVGEGAAPLLRVVGAAAGDARGAAAREEHLVPFVREIVPQLDAGARTALLRPPPGLLELGRRRRLLAHLRPLLLVRRRAAPPPWRGEQRPRTSTDGPRLLLGQRRASGSSVQARPAAAVHPRRRPPAVPHALPLAARLLLPLHVLMGLDILSCPSTPRLPRLPAQEYAPPTRRLGAAPYMPTGRALAAAGRADLVREVQAAGGFLEVAQQLGLRARRRPKGFWDSQESLEQARAHGRAGQGLWDGLAEPGAGACSCARGARPASRRRALAGVAGLE